MPKRDDPPPASITFHCIVKVLSSGKTVKCSSSELFHVSNEGYWEFCPEDREDFDAKSEYGRIYSVGNTKRMSMNNILFMSSDPDEVNSVFETKLLPSGSRLPNPKRRQTLTPTDYLLSDLTLMNDKVAVSQTKKANKQARTNTKVTANTAIMDEYINKHRGSAYVKGSLGKKTPESTSSSSKTPSRTTGSNSLFSKHPKATVTTRVSQESGESEKTTESTANSELLGQEIERLRRENEALKSKIEEDASTKQALQKLVEDVGHLKKTVASGGASSASSRGSLSKFVKEGSNPPEIEILPYNSLTLSQLEYIERNVFKFTAKVNKICDRLWGAEVHLYYVKGPKTSLEVDDNGVRIVDNGVFHRISEIIGAMKVLKEEKGVDTSESAVNRQIQKYTSYKRRQYELHNLTSEEKNKKKIEAKQKKQESLAARKGKKVYSIKQRKRVYFNKDKQRKASSSSSSDDHEEAQGNNSAESEKSQNKNAGSESEEELGPQKKKARKRVISTSDSEVVDLAASQSPKSDETASTASDQEGLQNQLDMKPVMSELMFSELDTASERVARNQVRINAQVQFNNKTVPFDRDMINTEDSNDGSNPMDSRNRWY